MPAAYTSEAALRAAANGASDEWTVDPPQPSDDAEHLYLSSITVAGFRGVGPKATLPRACAADSPFRFVVVDDPVQSMDPSKVDGLAQVLDELAATRQVVVFTHDNRLPAAVCRLDIDATSWEVHRRDGSVVTVDPPRTRSPDTSTTRGPWPVPTI